MTEKQKDIAVAGLAIKINVISGCPLPTDERHLSILESEIERFLSEHKDFHNLTIEEILNAFRLNAAGKFEEKTNHYQSLLNLDYIGAVLLNWVPLKRKIEMKAARDITKKNLLELEDMPGLNEDQIIDFSRNEWNRTQDLMYLESRAYDVLSTRGEIDLTNEQKTNIMARARIKLNAVCRLSSEFYQYEGNPTVETIMAKKISLADFFFGGEVDLKTNEDRVHDWRQMVL